MKFALIALFCLSLALPQGLSAAGSSCTDPDYSKCGDSFGSSCGNSAGQTLGSTGSILLVSAVVAAVVFSGYYLFFHSSGYSLKQQAHAKDEKLVDLAAMDADLLPSRSTGARAQ